MHVCVFVWLCKNMIQLLIDAFVSVPMPMCLFLFVHSIVQFFEGSYKVNTNAKEKNIPYIIIEA